MAIVLLRSYSVSPFQFADCTCGAALAALGFSRQTARATRQKAERYLLCVSVVVVVMGPGCVVCCVVVVLLREASEAHRYQRKGNDGKTRDDYFFHT